MADPRTGWCIESEYFETMVLLNENMSGLGRLEAGNRKWLISALNSIVPHSLNDTMREHALHRNVISRLIVRGFTTTGREEQGRKVALTVLELFSLLVST